MSVRHVADLLALAYEGFNQAETALDEELRRMSVKVVAKALAHPDAGAFFGGIQLALAEVKEAPFGNDPDIDDNDEGIFDPEDDDTEDQDVDEDSPAAGPAYEGVTDGDEEDQLSENDQDENKEQSRVVTAALANFRKFG